MAFQRLVEGGQREGRVRADNDGLPLRAVAVNDGKEHAVPPVRTVHVARPQLGREAVTLWIEDEERVIADRLEVTVVRRLLFRPVDRALGAVDIESHPPVRRSRRSVLDQCRVEASKSLVVPLLRQDVRLEPVERRGEGDAGLPPLARGQHPKRRVLGQPLGVVGVLVARQATVDGLAE